MTITVQGYLAFGRGKLLLNCYSTKKKRPSPFVKVVIISIPAKLVRQRELLTK